MGDVECKIWQGGFWYTIGSGTDALECAKSLDQNNKVHIFTRKQICSADYGACIDTYVVQEFSKCRENVLFDNWWFTDFGRDNDSLARFCAESLSRIHGGTYQSVKVQHNMFGQDFYQVKKKSDNDPQH